jgi:saccharopine dehydrogenase-like NADP-dependent oxidoreductase
MKSILVLGAGKSSGYLISYLIDEATVNGWNIVIADNNREAALEKTGRSPVAEVVSLNAHDLVARRALISKATAVISLLPPAFHYSVALDCLGLGVHFFTASYIDPQLETLRVEVEQKGLLFLCEIGLDPGIDHMSAMQMINEVKSAGGKIRSFKSHCGGLVAPESDDNPWHYKISWNPRNVVLAGEAGAVYKENGEITHLPYRQLFKAENTVEIPELGELCWYANRNSLPYMELYGLRDCGTFLRTTLRYPEFCLGWKTLVDLGFTNQTSMYDTDGMTLQHFFHTHLQTNDFAGWLDSNITSGFRETTDMFEKIQRLISLEEDDPENIQEDLKKFLLINDRGELDAVGVEEIKMKAAERLAWQKHEANLILNQLLFLGMNDDEMVINKGICSAADVLQFALEKKLALKDGDRDMIVMLHEIVYELDGKIYEGKSSLIVKGEDHIQTAMAKTVGLPLGIAASLFLRGQISVKGLQIPVISEVYKPVLAALSINRISFTETHRIVE